MQDNYKFRAALKAQKHSIIVGVHLILADSYTINFLEAKTAFSIKYPNESFDDFIDEIKLQDHVNEVETHDILINSWKTYKDGVIKIKNFTNLMQSTGVYDATKFKELSTIKQQEWLKKNKAEDWQGLEIFTGDITQIKYGKDHYEYGVVHYSKNSAGFYRGSTSVGSYKKQTKIVGNIYEGWPDAASYDVDFYYRNYIGV